MAVTVGTFSQYAGTDELTSGSFTYPHTHDTNSGIVVCIQWTEIILSALGVSLDAMAYAGFDLERVGQKLVGSLKVEIWAFMAVTNSGTNDLELTWGTDLTGAVSYTMQIFSANGRPTAIGDVQDATGSSTDPEVTITSIATTSLVVNSLGVVNGLAGDTTLTADDNDPGAGVDTEIAQDAAGTGVSRLQGGSLGGVGVPGSRVTGWTLGASRSWGQVACEIIDEQLQDVIGAFGVIPTAR